MKKTLILTVVFISILIFAKAQECPIQIQILEDKYMFGNASKIESDESSKKIEVEFTSEFMEVVFPVDGQGYLIKVVNEDCQAFCTKAKRVRQLHSGDEKLVRNLFNTKQEDIIAQLQKCNL